MRKEHKAEIKGKDLAVANEDEKAIANLLFHLS